MTFSRKIISGVLFLLSALGVAAQTPAEADTVVAAPAAFTARSFFATAPLEVLDMLRPTTRLDMIDYFTQADSILPAADALGGKSRLEILTDDYLRVAVTPVSTLEIKILPTKEGGIAMTLYTVGNDSIARDTEVAFFDSSLRRLPTEKYLKTPDSKRFFNLKGSGITEAEFNRWMPFQTVVFTSGTGDAPLTATPTAPSLLPDETRDRVRKIVRPALCFKWNGKEWKMEK